ncbi:sulfatase family protein [Flavobacterium algicola]|uniref:sulfatase family protein n=1 Tax=Flavobacterium algicola TaxID=556529 RepID=UPI001EFD479F|nr:sulfatase [Flavobacterium algicola]MCG9793690.1 sulfatase [Flavobacterium algicola]
MKTINIVKTTLLAIMVSIPFIKTQAQKKPNLIIIHTDEHSFRTLSCYQKLMPEEQAFVWGKGNNVTTTNIDKLADEGAICTRYYASSPVCTPSRASLVTGLHPQATGAPVNGMHLSKDVTTFAQVLKGDGYATSYVGKWHLSGDDKYQFDVEYTAGFDDGRYIMQGGHAKYLYFKDGKTTGIGDKQYAKLEEEDRKKNAFYVTDYFTDRSLEILERDKNKPFCLMLSIPDPHTPDYARPPYHTMYTDMNVEAPMTMNSNLLAQRPNWGKGSKKDKNEGNGFEGEALQQYFGMVKCIDDNVGRILSFLDKNNLKENTIVVFTSDHGDQFFEHNRKNKDTPYEASARIPFVIRYPEKIKPGKVIETAYTNVDFAPTILSIMGVKNNVPFHGMDTSADFLNDKKEITSNRITYFAKVGGGWVAAVDNRYKLVLAKNEKPWLLDYQKDPFELTNFYNDKAYKEVAQKLEKELFIQMKKYKEPALENKPDLMN